MNIRTSPANTLSLEELGLAVTFLDGLVERAEDNGTVLPEAVKSDLEACRRELREKTRADKEYKLRSLKLRKDSLLGRAEKLKNVQSEIDALEAELSGDNKSKARSARITK